MNYEYHYLYVTFICFICVIWSRATVFIFYFDQVIRQMYQQIFNTETICFYLILNLFVSSLLVYGNSGNYGNSGYNGNSGYYGNSINLEDVYLTMQLPWIQPWSSLNNVKITLKCSEFYDSC
jgi:hypothetical protein